MDIERLKQVLPDVVELVERRMPYAVAEAIGRSGTSIAIDNRERIITPDPSTAGIVITASNGIYLEEYATTTLEREPLLRQVDAWLDGLQRLEGVDQAPLGLNLPEPLQKDFWTPMTVDPRTVPLPEKLERLAAHQAEAREMDPRIFNASVRYNESSQQSVFAARGRVLSQEIVRTRLTRVLMVRDDTGNVQYDWDTDGGTIGYEILDRIGVAPYSRSTEELRDGAIALLSSERIPPGLYDCVCDPDVSGTVAHESFGHGVETDMFLKGRALAADYLGRRMAENYVNMMDDPTVPGAFGSYFFDDEGMLAAPVRIIEDGVFCSGISDLYSAARMGIRRTGHGRRQNFAHKSYARMSNTFFTRGTTPVADMIASVDDGIYLMHASSGMEDPKNWGIQLIMHYGKEIKNGKLTGRIFGPIAMTGSVPEVLASISQVGDDFSLISAMCGKGHKEYVMVSSGGPHLRLRARLS